MCTIIIIKSCTNINACVPMRNKYLNLKLNLKMDTFDEKNQSCKISRYCTFNTTVARYSCCFESPLLNAPIARYPYSAHRLMILLSVLFSAFTPTVLLNIYIAQDIYLRYCSILLASDTPDVRYFCYLKVLLIDSPAGRYS